MLKAYRALRLPPKAVSSSGTRAYPSPRKKTGTSESGDVFFGKYSVKTWIAPSVSSSRYRAFSYARVPHGFASSNICWSCTYGIGVTSSKRGATASRMGFIGPGVFLRGAIANDDQGEPRSEVVLPGNKRRRRGAENAAEAACA